MYHVYILRCFDGSYCVGYTQDLQGRVKAHNDGRETRQVSRRNRT